jgi:tetratricopeptide (TPR) repeat protein/spermidine synthase
MLRPVPPLPPRAAVAGGGLGGLLCALALLAGRIAGPSPRTLALSTGAALVGLALGARVPARLPWASRPAAAGAAALGLAAGLGASARLIVAGLTAVGAAGADLGLAIAGAVGIGAVVIGALARARPGGAPVALAGAAAGAALALVVGPLPAAGLGGAALAATPQGSPAPRRAGAWLLVPAGALAVALLSATQPMANPSPGGAVAFALAALATGGLIGVRRGGPTTGAALALVPLAVTPLLLVSAPDLVAELAPWVLGARPSRGRLLLLLPLLVAGAAMAPALAGVGRARGAPVLLGLGLLAGAALPPGDAPVWLAGGTAALVAAGTAPAGVRVAGALIVAGLLAADWQGVRPDAGRLATGVHRTVRSGEAWERELEVRAATTDVVSEVGVRGAAAVRAPDAWLETQGQRGRPDRWSHHVELQGTVATSAGREAEAEQLAGHLAGLLGPDTPRALVLGDPGARALQSLLAHPTGTVDVSTPSAAAARAVAALDPDAREAWLSSRVRLHESHPDAVLRRAQAVDLVVEIVRTPWRDAAHAAPDATHLDAIRAALQPDGVLVLAVHLSRFDRGAAAALARGVAERFGHTQLWVPPSGADTLFIVGSPRAPSLAVLELRAPRAMPDLRGLGVPSAQVLAGFAVGDGTTARVWEPRGRPSPALRMPDATLRKPLLHLATLAPHVAPPAVIWDLDGASQGAAELSDRIAGRQTFLALLGDASTGDLQGVFAAARDLVDREGPLATQALAALIEPQLEQARDALRLAVREGPSSRHWESAQRYATTARMLSPRSPEPPLLLGEVALAQGNLNRSQENFEAAMGLDERSTAARTGLARVAIARRDYTAAEGHLRDAARLNPQDWQAWSNLGRHLTETGAHEEAEEVLRRAATLAGPEATDPHLRLAELYLATDRPTTALVHAERAVALGGGAEAFYLRGRAYFDVDELDKAEEDFRRAVLSDSRHVKARGAIGHIRAMKGDLQAAAENFRQVVAMDPTNAAARENLDRAEALLRERELQGAGVAPPR